MSEDYRVEYTLVELDRAIGEIIGHAVYAAIGHGNRVSEMMVAASRAWVAQRPEDEHSAILRKAIIDVQKRGFLSPKGGVKEWDNEDA